jgi:hypothetical protein
MIEYAILGFGIMGVALWGAFNLLKKPTKLISWEIKGSDGK